MEALATYWGRTWVGKTEEEVIAEFKGADVEATLVAFDIETVTVQNNMAQSLNQDRFISERSSLCDLSAECSIGPKSPPEFDPKNTLVCVYLVDYA